MYNDDKIILWIKVQLPPSNANVVDFTNYNFNLAFATSLASEGGFGETDVRWILYSKASLLAEGGGTREPVISF